MTLVTRVGYWRSEKGDHPMTYGKYDLDEACIKCGALGAHAHWEAGTPPERSVEVLRVTCWKCGYTWFRDPLDAADTAVVPVDADRT